MTIKEALKKANLKLAGGNFDTPHLDAEVLLAHILNKSKEFLHTQPGRKLTPAQQEEFKNLIEHRLKKEPVAYLVGKKWFFGKEFMVNENVLIPRPETELICEAAIEVATKHKISSVLDIGTGSGNIIISLATSLPGKIKFVATDVSDKILDLASQNAKNLDCISKIKFIKSDLFSEINEKFDLIVANLPYVPDNIQIYTGEPKIALYGGKKGTEIYQKFFSEINQYLNKKGAVIIEIDSPAIEEMNKIIKNHLNNVEIATGKDLTGLDRIMIIKIA